MVSINNVVNYTRSTFKTVARAPRTQHAHACVTLLYLPDIKSPQSCFPVWLFGDFASPSSIKIWSPRWRQVVVIHLKNSTQRFIYGRNVQGELAEFWCSVADDDLTHWHWHIVSHAVDIYNKKINNKRVPQKAFGAHIKCICHHPGGVNDRARTQ